MLSVSSRFRLTVLGVLAALACVSAQAGVVTKIGTQGSNPNLETPNVPPPLSNKVQGAISAFNENVTQLGGNEFEGATTSFSFGDAAGGQGTATFVPDQPMVVAGASINGRYNVTGAQLSDGTLVGGGAAAPAQGHWLDVSSSFVLNFDGAPVTALSFFVVDLGDFMGALTLKMHLANGQVETVTLTNDDDTDPSNPVNRASVEGNLLFFGATTDVSSFTSVEFAVTQSGSSQQGNLDYIGLDSFTVGRYSAPPPSGLPEPASLALVGLALAAGGFARRRAIR